MNESLPHRLVLQGHFRRTGVLWNIFDSRKDVTVILCRSFDSSKAIQSQLQQIVPTTLRVKVVDVVHSS